MFKNIVLSIKRFVINIKNRIKQWSKPTTIKLTAEALTDLKRSRKDLIAENALLRQQLIVLNRQIKRPQLTQGDRMRLIGLARLTSFWKKALHIVQPDTLLRWHRDLFRRYWRWNSKPKQKRKPRISSETIALIQQMARENLTWGAKRIRGELLNLGIRVSKRSIQKYIPADRHEKSGQTWSTFLKNHFQDIWACDFTVVHDLLFRSIYIFVIMELHTRRVKHAGVTRNPTGQWVAQQLREATPWNQKPKYLIRDRDGKFGHHFAATARGIEILKTPPRSPRANAFCERFIGSLRRECLDHMLILQRKQLHRIVQEYIAYFSASRPHQGIDQQIPACLANGSPWPISQPESQEKIISTPILGGLHHCYAWAATS
jgi:transposase InsO family protein